MPTYLVIHLIVLIGAIVWGVNNAWLGMSKSGMWTFPYKRHRIFGYIFFGLVLVSFLLTQLFSPLLKRARIKIPGYETLGWIIFILSIIGVILGELRYQNNTSLVRSRIPRRDQSTASTLHPWFLILTIGLLFAPTFILLSQFLFR